MAYYYSVRGWLEADSEAFEAATALIGHRRAAPALPEQEALYLRGWTWIETPINWTCYLFYGADVTGAGVDQLRALLGDLCALGADLDGYFRITGEDGEQNLDLEIADDVLSQVELAAPSSHN